MYRCYISDRLRRFFATQEVLLVMKTLEDERYVVISVQCVSVVSRHIESTDCMIGASLSEPHTSVTSLRSACVCLLVSLFAWILQLP